MGRPKKIKTPELSEISENPSLSISEISENQAPLSEIVEQPESDDERLRSIEEILALSDSEMEPKVVEKPKRKPRAKKVKETIPKQHTKPYSESTYVLVPNTCAPKLKIGEECVWNVGEYECLD